MRSLIDWKAAWLHPMAKGEPAGGSAEPGSSSTLLRSISEGIRTIVTVTERLSDLRTEATAVREDLHRLAEVVYRIAGRLDGIEQRFAEIDKRIELAVSSWPATTPFCCFPLTTVLSGSSKATGWLNREGSLSQNRANASPRPAPRARSAGCGRAPRAGSSAAGRGRSCPRSAGRRCRREYAGGVRAPAPRA